MSVRFDLNYFTYLTKENVLEVLSTLRQNLAALEPKCRCGGIDAEEVLQVVDETVSEMFPGVTIKEILKGKFKCPQEPEQ